jgi:hypothetical protein
MFENGVVKKISGSKKNEVNGQFRILHNMEFNHVYFTGHLALLGQ